MPSPGALSLCSHSTLSAATCHTLLSCPTLAVLLGARTQESTPGAAGGYGGEATGIKSRVTKGRKLG